MTTTLVKNPLRTSLSMLTGHENAEPIYSSPATQPLGYLYAEPMNPGTPGEAAEAFAGYYDDDAQVWVSPNGITMGIATKTNTGSGCSGADCHTDDACA